MFQKSFKDVLSKIEGRASRLGVPGRSCMIMYVQAMSYEDKYIKGYI